MKKSSLKSELLKLKIELKKVEKAIQELKEDVDYWEDDFISFLDEFPQVEIFGNTYDVAYALKELDKIVYDEELNNWCDANIDDEWLSSDAKGSKLIEQRDELLEKIEDLENKLEDLED